MWNSSIFHVMILLMMFVIGIIYLVLMAFICIKQPFVTVFTWVYSWIHHIDWWIPCWFDYIWFVKITKKNIKKFETFSITSILQSKTFQCQLPKAISESFLLISVNTKQIISIELIKYSSKFNENVVLT